MEIKGKAPCVYKGRYIKIRWVHRSKMKQEARPSLFPIRSIKGVEISASLQ